MNPTLFGVPLSLYGIPCFLLSFAFIVFWPYKIAPRSGWRRFVLRWAHSIVWFLLGLAAIAGGSPGFSTATASFLALASVAVYAIFVFTLVTTKRPVPPNAG